MRKFGKIKIKFKSKFKREFKRKGDASVGCGSKRGNLDRRNENG